MNQTTQKTMFSRRFVPLIGSVLVCIPFSLKAQTNTENYSGINLGQADSTLVTAEGQAVANNDCAAAAAANGLAYLFGANSTIFGGYNTESDTTTENLITAMNISGTSGSAGTSANAAITGLQSFINASPAASYTLAWQIQNPTAAQLNSALAANDAVQLGIVWGALNSGQFVDGNDGGHFVSLTSIGISTGGAVTMSILDPWGNGQTGSPYNAGTTSAAADSPSVTVSTITVNSATVLQVQYGLPSGENPQDITSKVGTGANNFGAGNFDVGYIAYADFESIPEPSTTALLLTSLGTGLARLLRKKRTE